MKIFLHEITDRETELTFSEEEDWVQAAVVSVDERLEGRRPKAPTRPISVGFNLRKVDEVYVVSGKIKTYVQLVCSRCANPFQYSCGPQFAALFCRDPVMSGIAHLYRSRSDTEATWRPAGQNRGFARHAHHDEDSTGYESKDLDITYLSQDHIDLSDVITEQLQLQIPFQPLCNQDCKGMCPNCGADLNTGRCACAKVAAKNPFSVLRDFNKL